MKTTTLLLLVFFIFTDQLHAQSFAINTNGAAANTSAMLDVTSINKGVLIPRLTTAQRIAIATPGKGLLVYDSTLQSFYFHDGVNWQSINSDSNNLWRKNGNDIFNMNTGNVGIGTRSPKALLNMKGGALLLDSTIGGTPVSGVGTRLMWIPAKAAFRAGRVNTTQWDDANIGIYSVSFGLNNIGNGDFSLSAGQLNNAPGFGALAVGYSNTASGGDAVALGQFNNVSGNQSVGLGYNNIASGPMSLAFGNATVSTNTGTTAIGNSATATAYGAMAMGWQVTASNYATCAFGVGSTASGYSSQTFGYFSKAIGDYSNAQGYGTKSKSCRGFTVGVYNDSTDAPNAILVNSLNRIFEVGNGTADNARSNALTILQNGNIGIGELNPTVPLNFASTLGNKISLWGNVSTYYGLGIQPNLLQIFTAGSSNDIAFGYGSSGSFTENVRMRGNGYMGIGAYPNARLQVTGNETTTHGLSAGIQINNTASTNVWYIRTGAVGTGTPTDGFSIGDNTAYRLAINSSGQVGIGTLTPDAKLSVSGNADNATGNWSVFSDARIKNISAEFTDGLNVINKIRPIRYHYNDKAPLKSDDEQIGIVAQELEKIAPYMVSKKAHESFTDLREVNNQAYVFLLINAVKEQQQQIELLQRDNREQKQRIEKLEMKSSN